MRDEKSKYSIGSLGKPVPYCFAKNIRLTVNYKAVILYLVYNNSNGKKADNQWPNMQLSTNPSEGWKSRHFKTIPVKLGLKQQYNQGRETF